MSILLLSHILLELVKECRELPFQVVINLAKFSDFVPKAILFSHDALGMGLQGTTGVLKLDDLFVRCLLHPTDFIY